MSKIVPLTTGNKIAPIVPTSIEEVFRLATAISRSGLAPRDMSTAEALTVAIMHGMEIGLPPLQAINRIAVVNGRPTVWGDAIPALLWAAGFKIKEWIDGEGDARAAHCTITRRPDKTEVTRSFSVAQARTARLWGKAGPWQQFPDRMLQMRARGFAARDGASDVLGGLYLKEEVEDEVLRDITPAQPVPAQTASRAIDDIPEVPEMSQSAPADDVPQVEPDELGDAAGFLAKLTSDLEGVTDEAIRIEIWDANADLIERLSDRDRDRAEAIFEGRA